MRMQPFVVLMILMAGAGVCQRAGAALTLHSEGVVGIVDFPNKKLENADYITEWGYITQLLNMSPNATFTREVKYNENGTLKTFNVVYNTSASDYAGSVTGGQKFEWKEGTPAPPVPSGWQYALGKYDGPNAGYVLFYLGGQSTTLPTYPYSIWGEEGKSKYALSHYTVFSAVPEPTTVVAGALLLIPFGVSALRRLRSN